MIRRKLIIADLLPHLETMKTRNSLTVFGSGAAVGILGGLIGLGGAEFRLPLLISVFGFGALQAVILNKAMSLVVVASSLPFRTTVIPLASLLHRWDVIVTLLAGSSAGAWLGAGWATRAPSQDLSRILAVLLLAMAGILLWAHVDTVRAPMLLPGPWLVTVSVAVGFGIGVVASIMGVAGGELLIPTIVILFGADIKLAGSLSLAVSLPTLIIGFTRYSRDQSFSIIRSERRFLALMATGSLVGTFLGARLLGILATSVLLPILAAILVLSAVKVWRHS